MAKKPLDIDTLSTVLFATLKDPALLDRAVAESILVRARRKSNASEYDLTYDTAKTLRTALLAPLYDMYDAAREARDEK